jgi:hypothetical protein
MELEIITAEEARQIKNNRYNDDIALVMAQIKEDAKAGKNESHIYKELDPLVLQKLKELGYDVTPRDSSSKDMAVIYNKIHW